MKIEIGGGTLAPADWHNLDPVHGEGEWKRIAQDTPWPTEDSSVDYIKASHVMEHIPAGWDHRVRVMNEAWRVLKPGGKFEIIVPLFVFSGTTWAAIADPTHVSYWVKESFDYFTGGIVPNAEYGLSLWKKEHWSVVAGWEGHWIGSPVK